MFVKKITIWLCLTFFGLVIKSHCQDYIHYTTEDGLPSDHVYQICQDANGFIWFATNRGIVKYNGLFFKIFDRSNGLPNNDIYAVTADHTGRIWYQTKSQFRGYIYKDSVYKFPVQDSIVITTTSVHNSNQRIWFDYYTLRNGIFINEAPKQVNHKAFILKAFASLGLRKDELPFLSLYDPSHKQRIIPYPNGIILLDKNYQVTDHVLFPNKKKLAIKKKPRTGRTLSLDEGLLPNSVYSISFEHGILFMDLTTKEIKYFSFQQLVNKKEYHLVRCTGTKQEIQVSVPNHIIRFNYKLELLEIIDLPKALTAEYSYYDRDGNIWIAHLGKGVTLIPNTYRKRKTYLAAKQVKKIEFIDSNLYAGVNGDGFYLFQHNKFVKKISLHNSLRGIYGIKGNSLEKRKGLFIGDHDIYNVDKNSIQKIVFPVLPKKIAPPIPPRAFKDAMKFDHRLYILAALRLIVFNETTKKHERLYERKGLTTMETFDKNLYLGGIDGLFVLEDQLLRKIHNTSDIINTKILAIKNIGRHIAIATDGEGLYLYNKKALIPIPSTKGLIIEKIVPTNDSTLWLGTQKGIYSLRLKKDAPSKSRLIDSYHKQDGLLQNNTNDLLIRDSLLFAACDKGLVCLNIKNNIYKKKPLIYFDHPDDKLYLTSAQRKGLNVSFGVIDYVNAKNINFEYRLLPEQKDWQTTKNTSLLFNNLAPGDHTLEIKATDQHGNQNKKKLYISLLPAWWQTGIAKTFFVLLGLLLLILFMRISLLRIRKSEIRKANERKRLIDVELQALRSQMNPHFVHNSLNAIQYYIHRNENALSEKYLIKFSKLVRYFFEYAGKQQITISKEIDLLKEYLKIEQLRFEDKINFTITVDEQLDIEERFIPPIILQPIVENAVNHGIFHKKGTGHVHILFKYINEYAFEVTVSDDGIGINRAKKLFENSTKNYQSHSSDVLYKRLALLRDGKEWNITYDIKDISVNDINTGTLVNIFFNRTNNI